MPDDRRHHRASITRRLAIPWTRRSGPSHRPRILSHCGGADRAEDAGGDLADGTLDRGVVLDSGGWAEVCRSIARHSSADAAHPTADGFTPAKTQRAMHAGLDDHLKVTLHAYEGLDHGFAATSGERWDETGAQLADGRTEAFFAGYLA